MGAFKVKPEGIIFWEHFPSAMFQLVLLMVTDKLKKHKAAAVHSSL